MSSGRSPISKRGDGATGPADLVIVDRAELADLRARLDRLTSMMQHVLGQATEPERLYTYEEARHRLGPPGRPLSLKTVQRLKASGELRATTVGRLVFFSESACQAYLRDAQEGRLRRRRPRKSNRTSGAA